MNEKSRKAMQTSGNGLDGQDEPALRLHFASDPALFGNVLESVLNGLFPADGENGRPGLSDEAESRLEIVLTEVINNIAEHAYQERTDGEIELSAWRGEREVLLRFTDRGKAMEGNAAPNPPPPEIGGERQDLPEGGYGWFLINLLSRELRYERRQDLNILHIWLPLDEGEQG